MFKTFTRVAVSASLLVATGCAGSYHAIHPDRITTYQSVSMPNAPVEFAYQYSALLTNGANKKYVKKAQKKGYEVVAIRLKNNTSTDLNFSRDLELTFGDRPVVPVSSLQAANDLKQGVAIYLIYVLGIGQVGGTTDPNTGQTTGGTLFPWGPAVAAGNMLGASAANKNMRWELASYDLTNTVLHPGETVYGIIPLRETNVAPLRVTLRNQAAMTAPATTPAPVVVPQAAPAVPVAPPAASPAPTGSGR
jgi:hypothetical protein